MTDKLSEQFDAGVRAAIGASETAWFTSVRTTDTVILASFRR